MNGNSMNRALVVSVLIHSALVVPFTRVSVERPFENRKKLVVDYVVARETPKTEIAKKIDLAPQPVNVVRAETKTPVRDAREELARKEARIRSSEDYINYYQLLREKIRKRLKTNYRDYHRDGEVGLLFTLTQAGELEAVNLNGSSQAFDKTLAGIAVRSVKEAAPFPPFPQALALPRMSFNLTISFKKE